VKIILQKGLDQMSPEEALVQKLGDAYRGKGRFCRDSRNLIQ